MTSDWRVSIRSCVDSVTGRTVSAGEIAQATLQAIAAMDPTLHAFTYVDSQALLKSAAALDARLAKGQELGPLAGVPIGVKDLFDVRGLPTSYGGGPFEPMLPERDAAAVARLRQADALLVGKTRTSEFAWGMVTPQTINPRDHSLTVGASSGGSGAAVAAGLVLAALGTDTGGSIRIPAAHCGVAGIKPTYGMVSRTGVLPANLSLDTVGPLAGSVADLRAVLAQLVMHDSTDPASVSELVIGRVRESLSTTAKPVNLQGLRLGVVEGPLFEILDQRARTAHANALRRLIDAGVQVVEVNLPASEFVEAAHAVIGLVEGSALHTERMRDRRDEFGDDVRGLLNVGHLVPGVLLGRAQQARRRIQTSVADLFREHRLSAIVAPATGASPGPRDNISLEYLRASGESELALSAHDRTNLLANLTGQPALVVPTVSTSPPFGLQLIGRPFRDDELLDMGEAVEALLPI